MKALNFLRTRFDSARGFINRHRSASLIIASAVGIATIGNIGMLLVGPAQPPMVVDFVAPKPKKVYYAPLTGLKVSSSKATTKPVTAVMIENSPDARPQSGLAKAEVVYEAVAEGGITRFMALYQQKKPKLVGPVRSVRMYYVDWYAPWNASMVHVGGSFNALKVLRNGPYRDLDQFFNAGAYWRASDRFAPHNVYTNFAKIDSLNKSKKFTKSKPSAIKRDDVAVSKKLNAKKVNIKISDPAYNSQYRYNAKTKRYTRYMAGEPHKDRESGTITTKVVVALRVDMKRVNEDGYREKITTTGSDSAVVFQNGKANKVTWKKSSRGGQLKFVDSKGESFALARGTTWISAVPNDSGSVSWQ